MKRINLVLCLSLGLALVLFGLPAQAQAQAGLTGYFNLDQVVFSSKAGKVAYSNMEKKKKQYETELETKRKELDKLGAQYENKRKDARNKPEDVRRLEAQIMEKGNVLRQLAQKHDAELAATERTSFQPLYGKAQTIVREIGEKRGYAVILEMQRAGAFYVRRDNDLTNEMIKAMDK